MEKQCYCCHSPLGDSEIIPLSYYGRGVYLVDSTTWTPCTNPTCESGGGFTSHPMCEALHDHVEASTGLSFVKIEVTDSGRQLQMVDCPFVEGSEWVRVQEPHARLGETATILGIVLVHTPRRAHVRREFIRYMSSRDGIEHAEPAQSWALHFKPASR